jgi:hypothetical protein
VQPTSFSSLTRLGNLASTRNPSRGNIEHSVVLCRVELGRPNPAAAPLGPLVCASAATLDPAALRVVPP